MKQLQKWAGVIVLSGLFFSSCNNADQSSGTTPSTDSTTQTNVMKEENVQYEGDGVTMNGYIAYQNNSATARPAVIIIHEWWGLNDYAKRRARELAELGYVAMALDLYGNGVNVDNPSAADSLARPFYKNPAKMHARYLAALNKLKTYAVVDSSRIAAIGYCFGGAQVLNLARMGEDLKGVVSFHGNLIGVPLDPSKLKAEILVLHGNSDPMVPVSEVEQFRKEMEKSGAKYKFVGYDGATHAFSNPNATAIGQKFQIPIEYNAAADTASWNEMKAFFARIF